MPLTKATTNVVNLDKDTLINGLTAGKGSGNIVGNTVFGQNALSVNTTGGNNTAVGRDALQNNTTASNNTAVGYHALELNTIGVENTAIGSFALDANISGSNNTGIGYGAIANSTSSSRNTGIGWASLNLNTTGNNNTAVGYGSLQDNTTGNENTAVGLQALENNTTGASNSSLGFQAGYSNTTGSGNLFIGAGCNGSSATVSNEVNIFNSTVTARFAGAASAWSFVSDERDKKDIEDLTIGLDFINQLKSRKFKWDIRNCDVDKGKEASGFIAQEVLQVIEEYNAGYTGLVDTNNPDQYTFATSNLIPILVKAVQELSAKVAELEAK